MLRHIIHLHIPVFPIAVERVGQPKLRERPVAVAPLHSERALVLSASYEARREGIFKGMPLGSALKYCPDLIVVPPNPELTDRASKVLTKLAAQYTPLWEHSRPGHVYLDVTGTGRLWGKAKDTASRIRERIKGYLSLSGAVGVAGNKMVSSIASIITPSEAVRDVDHGQESSFMAPLRVDMLPGIGSVRKRVLLEELNIRLVREIAAMDRDILQLVFGREAYMIHQRAIGIDPTPVFPPDRKPAIAEQITLAQDENDDDMLLRILHGLVERCSHRLRSRSMVPRRAGLMIRYADQKEIRRQITLRQSSFWDFDLYEPLEGLFFKACQRRLRIRFMRVWFRDFSPPSSQLSLFSATSPGKDKKARVTKTMDAIRGRYGERAVTRGSGLKAQGSR